MLLKEGKVIRKWSVNNFPDEYQLTGPLEELSMGYEDNRSFVNKTIVVVAWFVFPLLFICLIDLIWERYRRKQRNLNEMIE